MVPPLPCYRDKPNYNWLILIALSGLLLTIICFILLRTFYKTNLIYLSMLIKAEDDLNFVERKNKNYFTKDKYFTYNAYLNDRYDYTDAVSFVKNTLIKGTLHLSMQCVFGLFLVGFCFEIFLILWKTNGGNTMEIWTNVFSIIIGLAGAYCLAFSLKIKAQYSKELIKELKIDEKIYSIPTNLSQREGLFWLGFILIAVAAIIQIFLLICKTGL